MSNAEHPIMRKIRPTAIIAGAIMAAGALASSATDISQLQKKLPFKSTEQKIKLTKAEKKRLRKMAQRAKLAQGGYIRVSTLLLTLVAIAAVGLWLKEAISVSVFAKDCEAKGDYFVVKGTGLRYYCVAGDIIAEH